MVKLNWNIARIHFLLTIIFFSLAFVSFQIFPKDINVGRETFNQALQNWDGSRYLRIAKEGYSEQSQYAFFPLFPLLVKTLHFLIPIDYFYLAVGINFISSFLLFQIFYKFLINQFSEVVAKKVIFAVLLFPTSFYLLLPYSESIFFFLVIGSFYLMLQKKWFLAALLSGLATGTRPVGIALAIAFCIVIYKQKLPGKWFLYPTAFIGVISYCIYLTIVTGYPFFFLVSQLD